MSIRVLPHVLLRAPLLPVRDLRRAPGALLAAPLGRAALALASPDLARGLVQARAGKAELSAAAALARYARRAAFRPTPSGLLAGVGLGTLGPRTRLASVTPAACLRPSWGRLRALGRALLEDPGVCAHVRLRVAPSLLSSGAALAWLAFDQDGVVGRQGERDPALAAVLDAAVDWTPWPRVRAAVAAVGSDGARDTDDVDDVSLDEYLTMLIDQELLHHDSCPPLVGPPPLAWMQDRLAALPADADVDVTSVIAGLADVQAACGEADVASARQRLGGLPGDDGGGGLHGVLAHGWARPPVLSRRAVERAAALASFLFRLQEALMPPAAERALDQTLLGHLEGITEVFGAGALNVAGLGTGAYGIALASLDDEAAGQPASSVVVARLTEALLAAARARRDEITLDAATLDPLLPAMDTPPSFEIVLSPARERAGQAPGTGWLLGLHAPAGASFGRFAEALGAPMQTALEEITAAEGQARPGERAADIVFAASPVLADLSAHPPARAAAVAVTGWSSGPAVGVADLELVVDPAAAEPLAVRVIGGEPVAPSPLHRVRSTTLPGGLYRLLAGWSFARQHAPWALSWGPLAELPRLPRVNVDGFVIAPASWRVPDAASLGRRGFFARWRREQGVPAAVQVGQGDELLFLDLAAPGAALQLARHAGERAWEIWPPLDRLVDEGGRRIEAVVAAVDVPDVETRAARRAATDATRRAGVVAPPAVQPAAAGWTTFRIHGAVDRQEFVLLEAVAPAVRAAQAAGQIDAWFFLRYRGGGPDGRDHLRVRLHAESPAGLAGATGRLQQALAPLREAGDVVTVETADYHREIARYGGTIAMKLAERLFQADSAFVLAALEAELTADVVPEVDRRELLARAFDVVTAELGLDEIARRALAGRRRQAFAAFTADDAHQEVLAVDYRARGRRLMATLSGAESDIFTPALAELRLAVRAVVAGTAPVDRDGLAAALPAILPAILHMGAVRLCGLDAADEEAAVTFWDRALEGLAARRRRPRG